VVVGGSNDICVMNKRFEKLTCDRPYDAVIFVRDTALRKKEKKED